MGADYFPTVYIIVIFFTYFLSTFLFWAIYHNQLILYENVHRSFSWLLLFTLILSILWTVIGCALNQLLALWFMIVVQCFIIICPLCIEIQQTRKYFDVMRVFEDTPLLKKLFYYFINCIMIGIMPISALVMLINLYNGPTCTSFVGSFWQLLISTIIAVSIEKMIFSGK